MTTPRIIGLTGYAGAGKDEAAKILMMNKRHVFYRVAFADELKSFALECGWNGKKDEAGRNMLQALGVFVRENIHPDAWINRTKTQVKWHLHNGHDIVFTDVRFINEIDYVRDLGGEIWRIDRPGVGPANDHVSEHEWTTVEPDVVIKNDGTIDDLRRVVNEALEISDE